MSVRPTRQQLGSRGEDLAADLLTGKGLTILERNWRCRWGEIDLIAADSTGPDPLIVFCEVKCRSGLGYGPPLEAITFAKLTRLRRLAAAWLAEHEAHGRIRLDAIGVVLRRGYAPQLTHVEGIQP
ncbi:YraN family protein [Granulicoccus phenolivorans]|uniref:YraN family protein n=1 Tax=Granulicoccus phenolivorans TaxID=266854 RepID=UPI00047A424E|nr:YraN family protein [Granulicoccus phenolivorans]